MVYHCATDSPKQHSFGFEFRVFPSRLVVLSWLEIPVYHTILPIAEGEETDISTSPEFYLVQGFCISNNFQNRKLIS